MMARPIVLSSDIGGVDYIAFCWMWPKNYPPQSSSHRSNNEFCTKQSPWSCCTRYVNLTTSLLPRSVCTTLVQLCSGHCRLLNTYKARITSGISDVCLECGVAPPQNICSTVEAVRCNSQCRTYGTIRLQLQISSTWTTDDARWAAGLSQQQPKNCKAIESSALALSLLSLPTDVWGRLVRLPIVQRLMSDGRTFHWKEAQLSSVVFAWAM